MENPILDENARSDKIDTLLNLTWETHEPCVHRRNEW